MASSRVSKLQRRIALKRKLHILRTLTNSKSVEKSCIIKDAFLYICKLKLQLEAIRREYHHLINNSQEVKVEKIEEKFLVRVTCKKRQDLLVSILDAFEILNLNVCQARVTCKYFFGFEAIVEANEDGDGDEDRDGDDQDMDVKKIYEAVLSAVIKD